VGGLGKWGVGGDEMEGVEGLKEPGRRWRGGRDGGGGGGRKEGGGRGGG